MRRRPGSRFWIPTISGSRDIWKPLWRRRKELAPNSFPCWVHPFSTATLGRNSKRARLPQRSSLIFRTPFHRRLRYSTLISDDVEKKLVVVASGGFDPNFRYVEDREMWLRCARGKAKFAYTGEANLPLTGNTRRHSHSMRGQWLWRAPKSSNAIRTGPRFLENCGGAKLRRRGSAAGRIFS